MIVTPSPNAYPMQTACTSLQRVFECLGKREVIRKFDGGALLREADRLFDVTGRLAACFIDHRNPLRIEYHLTPLVAQRVMAVALG